LFAVQRHALLSLYFAVGHQSCIPKLAVRNYQFGRLEWKLELEHYKFSEGSFRVLPGGGLARARSVINSLIRK
jgi:hypothetical protein